MSGPSKGSSDAKKVVNESSVTAFFSSVDAGKAVKEDQDLARKYNAGRLTPAAPKQEESTPTFRPGCNGCGHD